MLFKRNIQTFLLCFLWIIPVYSQDVPESLAACFRLALQNNIDIQVQKPLTSIAQADVDFTNSFYDDYFLFASYLYGKNDTEFFAIRNSNFNVGVAKRFLSGTEVTLEYGLDYTKLELNVDGLQALEAAVGAQLTDFSFWQSRTAISISQPLLRNFGVDINSTEINLAKKQRQIAEYEVERQINDTLSQVEIAYWTWVSLLRIKHTIEISIENAKRYKKLVEQKAGITEGVLPSDIDQAQINLNNRRDILITTNKQIKVWEDRLKRLIFRYEKNQEQMPGGDLPISDDAYNLFDVPQQQIATRVPTRDYKSALQYRPELKQIEKRLESADLVIQQRTNQLLPKLDLVGSFGLVGDEEDGDNALANTFNGDHSFWQLGVTFEYPLFNYGPKSQLRRIESEKELISSIERRTQFDICLQVNLAHHDVVEAVEKYDNVTEILDKAKKRSEGVERRYKFPLPGDFNLIFFVQDAEFQFTRTQINQYEAILQYKIAMARLRQAQGEYLKNYYGKYQGN